MIEIRLPKPGPEIENATITRWESKEGDKIQIGDILAIIKTPIGSFKVAAEEQGILESILQPNGSQIDFDEPIAIMRPDLMISDFPNFAATDDETLPLPIETETPIEENRIEEQIDTPESIRFEEPVQEPLDISEPTVAESIVPEPVPFENTDSVPEVSPDVVPESEMVSNSIPEDPIPSPLKLNWEDSPSMMEGVGEVTEQETPPQLEPEHIIPIPELKPVSFISVEVSPAAKKMADRLGIDLSEIPGTGDNGKILYIDVENAIRQREQVETQPLSDVETPVEAVSELQPEVSETNQIISDPKEETVVEPEMASQSFPVHESVIQPIPEPEVSEPAPTVSWEPIVEEPQPDPMETSFPLPEEPLSETLESTDFEEPAIEPASDTWLNQQEVSPVHESEPDQPIQDSVFELSSDPIQPAEESLFEKPRGFSDFAEVSAQFHLSKKDDLIIPFNNNRKAYSETQIESNRSIPHFYLFSEVDLTETLKWIKDHNQKNGFDITITDLIVKATGQALAMMPEMNAFVRNDRIILKRSINIGITTSVDEGVVTPVIPDVYHKSLHKISEVVKKNVHLATQTKVVMDYDTTFTIANLQNSGVNRLIPLITPPQTGYLAAGEIRKKVVPFKDFIAIRDFMELTLACDSRAVDVNSASKFLKSIADSLHSLMVGAEDPDWILGNEQLRLI